MSQVKNNTFLFLFIGVIAFLLILFLVLIFSGKKKNDSSSLNMEKVELLNNDNSTVDVNLKNQADQEIGKVEIKEDINIDMTKLFDKNDLKDTNIVQERDLPVQQEKKAVIQAKKYTPVATVKTNTPSEKIQDEPIVTSSRVRNGFNDSQATNTKSAETSNKTTSPTINVMVYDKQQIKSGSTLRMVSTQDFKIDGVTIPKNTMIAGIASMANQRVNISVPSILYNGQLFNVNFVVYDAGDGLQGINVPDLVIHDIAKEEANSTVSSVKINTPIVSVPINTSRKAISENSATITDNYRLILRTK